MTNEENSRHPIFFLNNLGLLGFSANDNLRNYLFSKKGELESSLIKNKKTADYYSCHHKNANQYAPKKAKPWTGLSSQGQ